jgi:hypothetical protein
MIAWNEETVVLSFRGTATFNNVLADLSVGNKHGIHVSSALISTAGTPSTATVYTCLQAWYAVHPPKRGIPMVSRPYVHQACTPLTSSAIPSLLAHDTGCWRPSDVKPMAIVGCTVPALRQSCQT